MSGRVLLVQDVTDRKSLDIVNLLPVEDRGDCTEVLWSAVRPEDLSAADIRLIVAVAHCRPSEAVDMFRWFSGSAPKKRLAFAVLPRQIDNKLLQDVSEYLDDFALWPSTREEIAQRIRRLVSASDANESVCARLMQDIGFAQLVGQDPAFLRALEKIPIMAGSQAPVLITGETGTGKEFSARAIHHFGKRAKGAFVPVDCGAIPDHVFENEMFGHVRGGYTDAHNDQKGLAAIADGGTLFLDEVDSLSPAAQGKLLRFLQERTFKPLGSSKFLTVDVHIIAATNRELEVSVRERLFRSDLYYRLNVLRLSLPPLRERPLDIPLLAKHFLDAIGPGPCGARSFSSAALRKLSMYEWPGNVRELHNVVQQAALCSPGPHILPEHIPLRVTNAPVAPTNFRAGRAQAIQAFERAYLEELLRSSKGNVTRAAEQAQRNRRSIGRLIKKYDIDRNSL